MLFHFLLIILYMLFTVSLDWVWSLYFDIDRVIRCVWKITLFYTLEYMQRSNMFHNFHDDQSFDRFLSIFVFQVGHEFCMNIIIWWLQLSCWLKLPSAFHSIFFFFICGLCIARKFCIWEYNHLCLSRRTI